MKILKKSDFLVLLQEVSKKLEDCNIKHEIPFVYRYKETFDHIKILIYSDTTINQIVDCLGNSEYSLTENFVDYDYKDFRFIFIITPEKDFSMSFYYYSWDILPTLMNVIFNQFGLDFRPDGIHYITNNRSFIVSNNIRLIVEFLELNTEEYRRGFDRVFDEVSYISSSVYFNPSTFKNYKLKRDFFFFEKEKQYEQVLKIIENFDKIDFKGYEFAENKDEYLLLIDTMFPNVNFLEKVSKLKFIK